MARSGEFSINAFPDFSGTLKELKQFQRSPQPEYQVCVATGDGSLVVKQTLVDFWCKKHASFKDQMDTILQTHNNEFNQKGLKRGAEESEEPAESQERSAKRLCLGTAATMNDLDQKHPERTDCLLTSLNAGQFVLHLSDSDSTLWIGSSTSVTVAGQTELWGFGSGDFAKGSEGSDLMSDTSAEGRWLLFALNSGDDYVVIRLNELLKNLEDSGEVNLQIAEHKLNKDAAGNFSVAPLEGVCFVLDPIKPKKKKAKAGP
eukprot:Skav207931  [mRNA]  locus=scaffold1441:391811:392884:- [translate_table: standard]